MTESPADRVWAAYTKHHPRAFLSSERSRLINKRLGEGYPADVLIDAIDGNHLDPHCSGENDRMKQYHSLSLILRDADHIERYAELVEGERPVDPVDNAWELYQGWAEVEGHVEALDRAAGTFPDEVVEALRLRVEGEPT